MTPDEKNLAILAATEEYYAHLGRFPQLESEQRKADAMRFAIEAIEYRKRAEKFFNALQVAHLDDTEDVIEIERAYDCHHWLRDETGTLYDHPINAFEDKAKERVEI